MVGVWTLHSVMSEGPWGGAGAWAGAGACGGSGSVARERECEASGGRACSGFLSVPPCSERSRPSRARRARPACAGASWIRRLMMWRGCARLRAVLASLAALTAPPRGGGGGGRPRAVLGPQQGVSSCFEFTQCSWSSFVSFGR